MRFSDGWTSGNVYIRIRPPFLSFPLPFFRVHSAVHLIDLCNYLDGQRLVGSRTRRRSQRISFFFFFNSLETRNFDYVHSLIRHCCFLLSLSMWYWTRRKIGGEREGGERGEGKIMVMLILNLSCSKRNEGIRYYSMERYFFFRILKFMERIFFSFFFSKNSLFFRYLTPFPLENTARYFRREATRNVKWINLKWWSVLKAPFNWLLASPNDVGGRKGQGQVLQRNIGCVEQSNDGLMEFRCCFLPILHTITQIIP